MQYTYEACGLAIWSDLELPMLCPSRGTERPEITIAAAPPSQCLDLDATTGTQVGPFAFANAQEFALSVPGIADFRISDGQRIIYRNHADPLSLASFLYSSALPILLLQRGFLVLNGSVVSVEGRTIVLLGSSVTGKSSVAAYWAQHGHRVLSDGICVIGEDGLAFPLSPSMKLWRQSTEHLGIPDRELTPVRPGLERHYWRSRQCDGGPAETVSHVFSLNIANSGAPCFKPVSGAQVFAFLQAGSRHYWALETMQLAARHLLLSSQLSQQAVCAKAFRASIGMDFATIADAILSYATAEEHTP